MWTTSGDLRCWTLTSDLNAMVMLMAEMPIFSSLMCLLDIAIFVRTTLKLSTHQN